MTRIEIILYLMKLFSTLLCLSLVDTEDSERPSVISVTEKYTLDRNLVVMLMSGWPVIRFSLLVWNLYSPLNWLPTAFHLILLRQIRANMVFFILDFCIAILLNLYHNELRRRNYNNRVNDAHYAPIRFIFVPEPPIPEQPAQPVPPAQHEVIPTMPNIPVPDMPVQPNSDLPTQPTIPKPTIPKPTIPRQNEDLLDTSQPDLSHENDPYRFLRKTPENSIPEIPHTPESNIKTPKSQKRSNKSLNRPVLRSQSRRKSQKTKDRNKSKSSKRFHHA